jgi:phage-related protein
MPVPVFIPPVPPTVGTSLTMRPRVRVAQFGDGYSQRTADGLNAQPQVWSVSWSPVTQANADTITDFLAARGGVQAFRWTPPGHTTQRVFICREWTVEPRGAQLVDVSATFVEVFDLGA